MMKGPADITGSSPGLRVPKTGAQPRQKVSAGRKTLPSAWEQSSLPGAPLQPGTAAVNLRGEVVQPCQAPAVAQGHHVGLLGGFNYPATGVHTHPPSTVSSGGPSWR